MLKVQDQNRVEETERLVREYFAGSEPPLCEQCGEELVFRTDYGVENRLCLRISCRGCGLKRSWRQSHSPVAWEPLHLSYFLEMVARGQLPRCPIDDSGVNFAEFEGGLVEFRCPFCNRRGRASLPDQSARLHLKENESIVFLTV